LDPANAETSVSRGKTTYTYTMTYSVRLATEKSGFEANKYYPTNGYTYLSVPKASGDPDKLAFTVPAVKGFLGNLSFTKTDLDGTSLSGAKFTLSSTTNGINWTMEAESAQNGAIVFNNIPSGCSFKLVESAAPANYQKDNGEYALKIAYGDLSWTGSSPLEDGEFKNTASQQYTTLNISKTWIAPAGTTIPNSITVNLKRDGNTYGAITLSKDSASWSTNPEQGDSNVTVTKGTGDWSCNVKVPYNKNGLVSTTYAYTIDETALNDWTGSVDGLSIKNSYNGTINVNVTKEWVSGIAAWPAGGITVKLLRNGTDTGNTITLTEGQPTGTFSNLPTVVNGTVAEYTVSEVVNDANNTPMFQTVKITGSQTAGYTITNAVNQEYVTVSGSKTWNDDNNAKSLRPDTVYVALFNGSTQVSGPVAVTASNNWAYTFSKDSSNNNLPKYRYGLDNDGKISSVSEISYTVRELTGENGEAIAPGGALGSESGDHYVVSYSGNNIINTLTGIVNVSASKSWIDVNGATHNGLNVTAQLMQNGTAYGEAKTVKGDGTPTTWSSLPKYDANGKAFTYAISENGVTENLDPYVIDSVSGNQTNGFTITNKLVDPSNVSVTGTKAWAQDSSVTSHPQATVGLFKKDANEAWVYAGQTAAVEQDGTYSFSGLPKYEERSGEMVALEYRVFEMDGNSPVAEGGQIGNYIVSYGSVSNNNGTFTQNLTNTITGTTSVTVNKTWNDSVNTAGRNAVFTLTRTASGAQDDTFSRNIAFSDMSGSSYTWSGLAKYDADGNQYVYSVAETTNGYSSVVTGGAQTNGTFAFTAVNTLNQGLTSVTVTKNWVDGGAYANRPDTITLYLYRSDDASKPYKTEVINSTKSGNSQQYTFSDLPLYNDARTVRYTYTIGEAAVTGAKNAYAAPVYDQTTYTVTNRLDQQYVVIGVSKIWVDPTGTAHPDVTFTLTGTVNGKTAVVNGSELAPVSATVGFSGNSGTQVPGQTENRNASAADHMWIYWFGKQDSGKPDGTLPKYDDSGNEIVYTAAESSVSGYDSVKADGYNTFTNTVKQAEATFTVTKNFANMAGDGVNSAAPNAPSTIYIQLMKNGQTVGDPVSMSISSNTGAYTFSGLDLYNSNGEYNVYTAIEVVPSGSNFLTIANGSTANYGNDAYTVSYGTTSRDGSSFAQTITNTYKTPLTYYYKLTRNYVQYRNGIQVNYASTSNWVGNAAAGTYTEDPNNYLTYTYGGGDSALTVTHSFVTEGSNTSVNVIDPNVSTYEIVLNYQESLNSGAEVVHVYRTYDKYTGKTTVDESVSLTSAYNDKDNAAGKWTIDQKTGAASFVPAVVNRTGYSFIAAESDEEGGNVPFGQTRTFKLYYEKTVDSTPPYTPPVVIPDPETPKTDVPETPTPTDPGTDITEPDTPKADAGTQVTGDELVLWIALALASATALVYIIIIDVRRRNGDER
jgi:hypothetical protein